MCHLSAVHLQTDVNCVQRGEKLYTCSSNETPQYTVHIRSVIMVDTGALYRRVVSLRTLQVLNELIHQLKEALQTRGG